MIKAEVTLICDECGSDETHDLNADEKPEDIIDREGWRLDGILLDTLLCAECAEKED